MSFVHNKPTHNFDAVHWMVPHHVQHLARPQPIADGRGLAEAQEAVKVTGGKEVNLEKT